MPLNVFKQMKIDLKSFHSKLRLCKNRVERRKLFMRYANKKYRFKTRMPIEERRKKFLKIKKFAGFPLKRMAKFRHCGICYDPSNVRHHIISLQNGGDNQKRNIIGLCEECHNEVHPWLN